MVIKLPSHIGIMVTEVSYKFVSVKVNIVVLELEEL